MDKETLAQAHPELLAQIQAEAKAEAEQAHKAALVSAVAANTALVRVVAGEGAAAQVAKLSAAGFTVEQIDALAPMLAATQMANTTAVHVDAQTAQQPEGKPDDSGSRADVLAALRSATPTPVNTSAADKGVDAMQAAIDQISSVEL